MAGLDGLDPPFKAQVQALLAAAGGKVGISSGWRSSTEQATLYARYLAGNGPLAAKPGSSKHECGLAVDFSGDLALAAQLAPQYGLVRTVPSEAWHFEPTYAAGKPCGAATTPQGTFTDTSGNAPAAGGFDTAATASDLAGCAGIAVAMVVGSGFWYALLTIVFHVHVHL